MKVSKLDGSSNICGKRLRELRKLCGISQEEMAGKLQIMGLDVTQKTISRMEMGKRVIMDYELKYLADVLKVSIYDLLDMSKNISEECFLCLFPWLTVLPAAGPYA